MKFNKKITVTALSTVLGLGLVGSISGAVAWYQYSTRATTSIIGTSTGNGGTLQIKKVGSENWARDLNTTDLTGGTPFAGFAPVTFGGFDGTVDTNTLPAKAYKEPSRQDTQPASWTTGWKEAVANTDYVQYSINLQALELTENATDGAADYKRVAKDVYLSNIVLEDVENESTRNPQIINSIRVHIAVTDSQGSRAYLLSVADLSSEGLKTFGNLDLDGDGADDTVGAYEWDKTETKIIYGENDTYLKSLASSSIIGDEHPIAKTPADDSSETTITVTIWSEGWSLLDSEASAMWDPTKHYAANFHVGLTFDVGDDAFRA